MFYLSAFGQSRSVIVTQVQGKNGAGKFYIYFGSPRLRPSGMSIFAS